MGHHNSDSSSSGLMIAIMAVAIIGFVGLALLGAGTWLYSSRMSVERSMVMAEQAQAEAADAEALRRKVEAELAARQQENAQGAQQKLQGAKGTATDKEALVSFQVHVDQDGKIQVDGEPVDGRNEMIDRLTDGELTVEVEVQIAADDDCPFQHVRNIIQACEEAGIKMIHVQTEK